MKVTKNSNHWLIEAEEGAYITQGADVAIEERMYWKKLYTASDDISALRDASEEERSEYLKSLELEDYGQN